MHAANKGRVGTSGCLERGTSPSYSHIETGENVRSTVKVIGWWVDRHTDRQKERDTGRWRREREESKQQIPTLLPGVRVDVADSCLVLV